MLRAKHALLYQAVALFVCASSALQVMADESKSPVVTIEAPEGKRGQEPTFSARCEEADLAMSLGAVLHAIKADGKMPVPEVSLILRDRSVREKPRPVTPLTTAELIAYFEDGGLPERLEPWEKELVRGLPKLQLDMVHISLNELIRYACVGASCTRGKRENTLVIGPTELLGEFPPYIRVAYQLPRGSTGLDVGELPLLLAPSGPSCAYDPETGLFIVIGERPCLHMFQSVMKAMGARVVSVSPPLPPLLPGDFPHPLPDYTECRSRL